MNGKSWVEEERKLLSRENRESKQHVLETVRRGDEVDTQNSVYKRSAVTRGRWRGC